MEQEETVQTATEPDDIADTEQDASAQTEDAADTPPKKRKRLFSFNDMMEVLETMLFSVFVILMVFAYLIRPVTVDGNSMLPTLHNADRLLMFRLCYQPKQGDIVVVSDYGGNVLGVDGQVVPSGYSLNENLIKRVIAVEGQKLEIDASTGSVYIDDVLQDEPYINDLTTTDDHAFQYPITIPEGYVFVMGDNRNHSTDSRNASVGLVKKEDVLGTAFFRYYAADDEDHPPKGEVGFIG